MVVALWLRRGEAAEDDESGSLPPSEERFEESEFLFGREPGVCTEK